MAKPMHSARLRTSAVLALLVVCAAASDTGNAHARDAPRSAVPLAQRGVIGTPVVSPDGARRAIVRRAGNRGAVVVEPTHGGQARTLYSSNDACCGDLVWSSRRLLIFGDDYRVRTVDVITGRVRWIAGFSNYAVSHDGRWLAGWADSGGHSPETIYVVSVTGAHCRVVPRPATADDSQVSFTADGTRIRLLRRTFAVNGNAGPGRWLRLRVSALPRETLSACLAAESQP
jgi:hypothetical protein